MIANMLFIAFDPRWLRALVQAGLNILSLYVLYMLYQVFPFDFGVDTFNWLVRLGLIVAMLGVVIGTVVELVRVPFGRR